jgi:hypothetical protein
MPFSGLTNDRSGNTGIGAIAVCRIFHMTLRMSTYLIDQQLGIGIALVSHTMS